MHRSNHYIDIDNAKFNPLLGSTSKRETCTRYELIIFSNTNIHIMNDYVNIPNHNR